jgi:hypothetical protein
MMEAQAGSGMGCGYGGEIPMSSECDDNFPIFYSELSSLMMGLLEVIFLAGDYWGARFSGCSGRRRLIGGGV